MATQVDDPSNTSGSMPQMMISPTTSSGMAQGVGGGTNNDDQNTGVPENLETSMHSEDGEMERLRQEFEHINQSVIPQLTGDPQTPLRQPPPLLPAPQRVGSGQPHNTSFQQQRNPLPPSGHIGLPPVQSQVYQQQYPQQQSQRIATSRQQYPPSQPPYQMHQLQQAQQYPAFQQSCPPPQQYPPSQPYIQPHHQYQQPPQPGCNQLQFYGTSQDGYPLYVCTAPAAAPLPAVPPSTPHMDKCRLEKWGVRFDGTNKTLNVQEFIFRVGALKRDYNCSDFEFLRSFHLLLDGPALDWFWTYRRSDRNNTWEGLQMALLSQYRQYGQEHQIQMQILNRRQLPQESVDDFFNAVIKLRNQQIHPYEEGQMVEIMRGNLKPSIAQMMFAVQTRSISDFCREAKRAESVIINRRQQYQQRSTYPPRVNELDLVDEDFDKPDLEVDGIRSTSHYTCWNCKVVGHSFIDCPEPITRQFCFRCGQDGVVAPKCQRCQGNRPRYSSRTGQARSTEV